MAPAKPLEPVVNRSVKPAPPVTSKSADAKQG
jgi:hypothetical protein